MFLNFEKFLNRPLPPNPTFFDVGANKGLWQDQIIALYPKCIIYAFEPIPGILPKRENVISQKNIRPVQRECVACEGHAHIGEPMSVGR